MIDPHWATDQLLEGDTTIYLNERDPDQEHGYVVGEPHLGIRLGMYLTGGGLRIERMLVARWVSYVLDNETGIDTIGSWTDSDTGARHYDVGTVIRGLEGALTAARARGELAIWDIANAQEIRVDRASRVRIPYSD